MNQLLGVFDFEREFKSRNNFLLTVGITVYLGLDEDDVIIDFGRLINPERETHLSDPKGIDSVYESEIGFWERGPIVKKCLILNRPVALRVLHEFLDLKYEGRGPHYVVEFLIRLGGLKLLHKASHYHIEGDCVHQIEATEHSFKNYHVASRSNFRILLDTELPYVWVELNKARERIPIGHQGAVN